MLILKILLTSAISLAGKPVLVPFNDNYDLALKDANQFKIMFYGYIVGFIAWFGKMIYDMFIKKQDKTEEKIDDVLRAIAHMEGKITNIEHNFVNRSEIRMTIRDEIQYANDLRSKE